MLPQAEIAVVRAYENLMEKHKLWQKMTWKGIDVAKTPEDMWLYQEAIWNLKPELIVEFGTSLGGTALFYADILDLIGSSMAQVITVDIKETPNLPEHKRLTCLGGESSLSGEVEEFIRNAAVECSGPIMVIEDSDHTAAHVRAELDKYSDIVTPGSYFVVEDLSWPELDTDVRKAMNGFLFDHPDFQVDATKDKYLVTLAPGGWLKRIR